MPVEAGAVHEVEPVVAEEKEPPVEDQAKERVSPGLGYWAVAAREMTLPVVAEEEDADRDSMRGAAFRKAGGALTCWRVRATTAVCSAAMETPEAEPSKSRVPEASKA